MSPSRICACELMRWLVLFPKFVAFRVIWWQDSAKVLIWGRGLRFARSNGKETDFLKNQSGLSFLVVFHWDFFFEGVGCFTWSTQFKSRNEETEGVPNWKAFTVQWGAGPHWWALGQVAHCPHPISSFLFFCPLSQMSFIRAELLDSVRRALFPYVYFCASFRVQVVAMGEMAARIGLIVVLWMIGANPKGVCGNP